MFMWRLMVPGDLDVVNPLSDALHPDFPEHPGVFIERMRLFPAGCFTYQHGNTIGGYCLAHPWRRSSPPRLNRLIEQIPANAATLFVHDIGLRPARGIATLRVLVDLLIGVARDYSLDTIDGVAVHGTSPIWKALGYAPVCDTALSRIVRNAYGPDAIYMRLPLRPTAR